MTPRIRKFVLTSHITFSVGWLGAVAVFIVLAIAGLTTIDNQLARSYSLAMKSSAWFVILPFCLSSLFTGIAQAIWTKWGLFRHYWIVVKLFLTVVSTILLLLHLQPISYLAEATADTSFSSSQQAEKFIDLIVKAAAAILALLAATTISIYKPWGKVHYVQPGKNQHTIIQGKKKSLRFYMLLGLMILIVIFIIMHLLGGGMSSH